MRGFSTLMGKAFVEFEVQDICQTGAAHLRTGCEVVISLDPEGLLQVQVPSGLSVGLVPSDSYCAIPKTASRGSVRTLRRAPGGGAVVQCLVRVKTELPQTQRPQVPELRREEQPLESTSLKQADLQALAESEELRGVLGDTRLQSLIQSIDSDPDREQALKLALEGPDFRAFTDKLLAVIAPVTAA